MPEIPQFTATETLPAIADTARVDPSALGAPGRAQEQAGQRLEQQIGGNLDKLADWQNYQYVADNWAEGTTAAHDKLQNEIDGARQSGDYQGIAKRVTGAVQADLQQRLDNAPSGMARARLERHYATLQDTIGGRAALFEHGMGVQDSQAKLSQFGDTSSTQILRDPTLFLDRVSQAEAMVAGGDAARQLGITEPLNPKQSADTLKALRRSFASAALLGTAVSDPIQAANDLKAGRYDAYLDAADIEKLKPQLDAASVKGWRARLSPFNNPGDAGAPEGPSGPQPNATDAEIDARLAPVVQRESRGRPNIGWKDTDLSNVPLTATGFPDWPGKPGPAGNSTAAGLYAITKTTWDPIAEKLGIHDFSPDSQRAVARELYRQRGMQPWAASAPGPGGLSDLFSRVDKLNLDPEQAEALKRGLHTDYAAIEADQARQQHLADKALEQRSQAAENLIIADSRSDQPKITARDVATNPDLKPDAKMRMIAFLAKDGNVDPGLSHATAVDLMKGIAGGTVKDQAPILDAFNQSKLNWGDFDHLNKQLADVKTPGGEVFGKRKEEFLKAIEPQIDKSAFTGIPDLEGKERFYQYRYLLDQKIDDYKKQNKNPLDLIDPSKPDYFGKPDAVRPYQGALTRQLQDALGSRPAGATPAAPPPPPPTATEYLRRNPGLRAEFDAKYGAGAAARVLAAPPPPVPAAPLAPPMAR